MKTSKKEMEQKVKKTYRVFRALLCLLDWFGLSTKLLYIDVHCLSLTILLNTHSLHIVVFVFLPHSCNYPIQVSRSLFSTSKSVVTNFSHMNFHTSIHVKEIDGKVHRMNDIRKQHSSNAEKMYNK